MSILSRSRSLRLFAAAAALIGLVWLLAPPSSVPLYDGVGFPDEPYRYVVAPAGAPATPAPTPAFELTNVQNGVSSWVNAYSQENGPQVSVLFDPGEFTVPAGTSRLTVRADPQAPSGGFAAWGNVYKVTATGDAGPVTVRKAGLIELRAPAGPPPLAVLEFDDGTGWRALPTDKIGNDIYQAPLPGLGRYALVRSTKPAGHSTTWLVVVPGAALAVLCGLLLAVRIRRRGADESGGSLVGDVLRFAEMAAISAPTEADLLRAAANSPGADPVAIRRLVQATMVALEASKESSLNTSVALTLGKDVVHRLAKAIQRADSEHAQDNGGGEEEAPR